MLPNLGLVSDDDDASPPAAPDDAEAGSDGEALLDSYANAVAFRQTVMANLPCHRELAAAETAPRPGHVVPIVIGEEGPIGATLQQMRGNLTMIKAVRPGGNAEKAGLMAGDLPLLLGQRIGYEEFIQLCKTKPLSFQVLRESTAVAPVPSLAPAAPAAVLPGPAAEAPVPSGRGIGGRRERGLVSDNPLLDVPLPPGSGEVRRHEHGLVSDNPLLDVPLPIDLEDSEGSTAEAREALRNHPFTAISGTHSRDANGHYRRSEPMTPEMLSFQAIGMGSMSAEELEELEEDLRRLLPRNPMSPEIRSFQSMALGRDPREAVRRFDAMTEGEGVGDDGDDTSSNNDDEDSFEGDDGGEGFGRSLTQRVQSIVRDGRDRFGSGVSALARNARRRLRRTKTRASGDESELCIICQSELMPGGASGNHTGLLYLPCSHRFHNRCVQRWLHDHSSCPVCRYELTGDE